ncbi:MAG: glycosyltransferase family 4 protein [Muribaculaceae bacterium]|nr:glycosyltransferase family 4 protein [Muribaculaceae bacterium]
MTKDTHQSHQQLPLIMIVTGMNVTKYGSLERFFLRLIDFCYSNYRFVIVYNDLPEVPEYINQLKETGCILEILSSSDNKVIKNIPSFIKLLKKYRPQIVHFNFSFAALYWAPIAKIYKAHTLWTLHSCLCDKNDKQINRMSDFSIKHRIGSLNGRLYYAMDKICGISKYVVTQFSGVYKFLDKKIEKDPIYFGIDDIPPVDKEHREKLRKENGINSDEIVVATTLFAVPMKGADILINAAIYNPIPNIKYIIIGCNPNVEYTQSLVKLTQEKGISNQFIWVGITNDVNHWLCMADIYVQPSRTEALSFASIEALRFKIPVIGSNIGGLPELSNTTFEVGDIPQLNKLISEYAENIKLRENESKKAYNKYTSLFKGDNSLRRYLKCYDNLLYHSLQPTIDTF